MRVPQRARCLLLAIAVLLAALPLARARAGDGTELFAIALAADSSHTGPLAHHRPCAARKCLAGDLGCAALLAERSGCPETGGNNRHGASLGTMFRRGHHPSVPTPPPKPPA
ncbi:hypothetical protein HRbin40_01375 [bacterium HR40]|nr:hypothetical protein HRbin40_01375 [bacterium HR40]